MSTIEAVSGATETSPSTRVENPGATLDRDAFLKLLVAQLKYQDPTKPADTSQMLAQSAQLTMVDRLNELAAAFDSSAATQRLSLAGTIVGREISFLDPDGVSTSGVVRSARIEPDGLVLVTDLFEVPYDAVTGVQATTAAPSSAPEPAPAVADDHAHDSPDDTVHDAAHAHDSPDDTVHDAIDADLTA